MTQPEPAVAAGGIAAVKDRLVGKGYRFGSLKKPFGEYYEMISIWSISIWRDSRAAANHELHRCNFLTPPCLCRYRY
jgi:hypothetical protein